MEEPKFSKPTFDAPIAGENFTSDTKNYPWHRPPEYTDYDEAIDYILTFISDEQPIASAMSLLDAGISLPTVVDMIVTGRIANGYVGIDLGILIAGPIARFLEIMAMSYDIEVSMGKDDDLPNPTPAYVKSLVAKVELQEGEEELEEGEEKIESETEEVSEGLMGAPSKLEQDKMLGLLGSNEEEEITEEEE